MRDAASAIVAPLLLAALLMSVGRAVAQSQPVPDSSAETQPASSSARTEVENLGAQSAAPLDELPTVQVVQPRVKVAKPKPSTAQSKSTSASGNKKDASANSGEGGNGGGTASAQKDAGEANSTDGSNGFLVQDASVGTMTQTPLIQTPMTVEVIPQRVLQEQGITSTGLSTALAYVGVQTSGFGTQGETLTFRGFTTSTTLWNGFRIEELTPTYIGGIGGVWMDNVQRLEVLKGPSSILYGQAEPGGTVNVLTKKPQKTSYAAVDAGTGSWDQYRVGADVTGALSADKSIRYRIIASTEESDSWYRWGPNYYSQGIAPAIEWDLTSHTKLAYEGQYRSLQGISGQSYMPIDPFSGEPLPVDPSITLLPGNESVFEQNRSLLTLVHDFNSKWSLTWKYMNNDVHSPINKNNFAYYFNFPIIDNVLPTNILVGFNQTDTTTDATILNVVGAFNTFGIKHKVGIGGEYYSTSVRQISGWDFNQITDYFHPDNPKAVPGTDFWNQDSNEYAIYMQDQIELPWNWHFLLGGRYQNLEDHSVSYAPSLFLPYQDIPYENAEFLPQFGVLWEFWPKTSIYYSYSESMGAITGIDYLGQPIDPEFGKQHEVGLKREWLNSRLITTAAIFDITKFNISSADPAHPGFNIGVGEVNSKGFELALQGAMTENWSLLVNYSYARPFVVEGSEAGSIYTGATIVAGELLPYVSNETFSVWTSYAVPMRPFRGLTLGGGFIWASAPNPIYGATILPQAYQITSLFASYDAFIRGHKTKFQLNINNIFDEEYLLYEGDDVSYGGDVLGGNWGTPREIKFNLKMEL